MLHDPDGQVIEYTQYMPLSLHSEDRGKHLGEHRISKRLDTVMFPVKDVLADRAFYVEKLAFDPGLSSAAEAVLVVPGSDDRIVLANHTHQKNARLRFSVPDLGLAETQLRRAGLDSRMRGSSLFVIDPDGNEVVFEQKIKHPNLVR
jgi:hypothetical protein